MASARTEDRMDPGAKSELLELLSGVRRLPLKEARILSEEHKAVLLVVMGYRQKGGVSKLRVGEILGLEASYILGDLLSFGLIYCDPSRELNFGVRKEIRIMAKLDLFFERTSTLASRRLKREIERRGTLGEFALEPEFSRLERIPPEESGSDLFRSDGPGTV